MVSPDNSTLRPTATQKRMSQSFIESASWWANVLTVVLGGAAGVSGFFAWYFASKESELKDSQFQTYQLQASNQVATLNKEAEEARERAITNENARLELAIQLNKTRADLLRITPENQRLVSVSASVWIHTPKDVDFIKPNIVTDVGGVAELSLHFGTNRIREISLYSYKFSQWRGGITDFRLAFDLDKDIPSPSMEIPAGLTPKDLLEKCDLVRINARFLPRGLEIGTGKVSVVINSVLTKEFLILPQFSGGGTNEPPSDDRSLSWALNTILATPAPAQQ
jgi:hypothetical protein